MFMLSALVLRVIWFLFDFWDWILGMEVFLWAFPRWSGVVCFLWVMDSWHFHFYFHLLSEGDCWKKLKMDRRDLIT